MNQNEISRRIALRTLLLGAAGAAVAACGGSKDAPPATAAPAVEPTPAPSAPAAAPGAAPAPAVAGALTPLDPKDPQAVALGYVTDAATLDPVRNPPFAVGQNCANCLQFKGAATDAEGPCALFAGRSVAAAGWCKVWVARPA